MPSRSFSATLPVKPSVTMTSDTPTSTSLPSTLPMKSGTRSVMSSWAACASCEPFDGSSPMLSSATRGPITPSTTVAYAAPICANCSRFSGLQSAFAPTSSSTHGGPAVGITVAIAGRWTPLMRPMISVAAAIAAPVLPAEKNASASPSRTRRAPTTIEESRLLRTAVAGCSPISMISVHATARTRSPCSAANGSTTSAGPVRTTCSPESADSAAVTPSRTTAGALSPPTASTATTIGRLSDI